MLQLSWLGYGGRRPFDRSRILPERHGGPQAGMIVLQLEHRAVQARHRLHQAQAQSYARGAAAGIAAIEALGDLAAVGLGDTRTAVGDRDLDALVGATADGHDDAAACR